MDMYLTKEQVMKSLTPILMTGIFLFASCSDRKASPQRTGILDGAPNFRDLGGYSSANGRRTVWRKVFRSQMLAQLSDRDVERLKELGVRTVIDFRDDDEVMKEPSRLPESVRVVRLPIVVGSNDTFMQKMGDSPDSLQCVDFMQTVNRSLVTEFAPQYRAFFAILLQAESYPIVFHCTAGKDRTGFAAALLLSALNVDWDTVMDDYLLTNQFLKPQSLSEEAIAVARLMWSVQPSYLSAAKEEIITTYGSIDNYLNREMNVGKAEKERLMQYLLE
ncbi:MAG: tyrosine-protein phosphatase [Prevotellaceae bacterium]|jgi:protein-tyrosine phosphatase|nr:tyrosine-protein phosphatase [Prevotellaceae bacterium]